jgi:hypothetical protein
MDWKMGASLSLIPELEEVVQHGSRQKRVETLRRITALFLDGARSYNDQHVGLFDDVFGILIEEIEAKARAELANRLAPVSNAPVNVLRRLAHDDDIAVAGPVLTLAPRLPEDDLVGVARTKSQRICKPSRCRGHSARRSPTNWCDAAIARSRCGSPTIAARAFPRAAFRA